MSPGRTIDFMAPRDGFEPPTNGLTGRPTRSRSYRLVTNQRPRESYTRQNTVSYTPLRLRGKHLGYTDSCLLEFPKR